MMEQKSGKIINISSIQGLVGATPQLAPPFPAYCAAKGGVINLTRELALEYAPFGINVNCVAPGPFETEIVGPMINDPQFKELMKATFPLRGGIGKPEDLNGTIIFLASKASDFVSGHTLVVDQGFLAH
jgi:NAD(P)-dependent dehydrogenase (short-subunit alcohol dehydrogenase family)